MSNELTEAERAVAEILLGNTIGWEDKAREIVAAVRPIIEAEALRNAGLDNPIARAFHALSQDNP